MLKKFAFFLSTKDILRLNYKLIIVCPPDNPLIIVFIILIIKEITFIIRD